MTNIVGNIILKRHPEHSEGSTYKSKTALKDKVELKLITTND